MLKLLQLIAFGSMALVADAQPPAPAAPPEIVVEGVVLEKDTTKEQNIIITKKGNNREKMTIVVDGDNITVNGRPVDAFETTSDGRSIKIRKTDGDVRVVTMPRLPKMRRLPSTAQWGWAANSNRGFMGVTTTDSAGYLVLREVVKKSPADSAGLQRGDVIVSIDGKPINIDQPLGERLAGFKPGQKIKVGYRRAGKERSTEVKLGRQNNSFSLPDKFDIDMERFGADMDRFGADMERFGQGFSEARIPREFEVVGRLNTMGRPRLGLNIEDLPQGDGVRLFEAPEAETVAAKAGLQQGDVITTVNGTTVKDVDAMRERVRDLKPGDKLTIGYQRNGRSATTELVVPKRIKKAGL